MSQTQNRAPSTRRDDVVDTLHGVRIPDPYRWLEEENSPEVAAWTAEQNAYTRAALDAVPDRDKVRARLTPLMSTGTVTAPIVRGDRHFYTRREGEQNQPVLLLRHSDGTERVLLDPNTAKASGTVALDWWYPSHDGKLLAYGYSDHGDEKSTLYILDVDSGAHLPDVIPHTRYCSLAWEPSGAGFYYTRYPTPGTVPEDQEDYHTRILYHRLGTDPAGDPILFGEGRDMTEMYGVDISPGGRWLVVTAMLGWTRCDLYLRDLAAPDTGFRALVEGLDALLYVHPEDDALYIHTNWQAPHYHVMRASPEDTSPDAWREIIPERPDATIEYMNLLAGKLALNVTREVAAHAEIYDLSGAPRGEIALPPLCSIMGLGGEPHGSRIFVAYESYTVPPTVDSYDPAGGQTERWAQVSAPMDLSSFDVRQVWYTSRDGTRVPMTVVSRKGIKLDGSHPAVLQGYGGFNVSLTSAFNSVALFWVELGGIYAVANLRGGAEFGEDWHRAGMLEHKQNVFDDFIAAAEYLISAGYTSSSCLAIRGGSNGGLLVGAAMVQRPDLFRAVVCQVPLLDMLRYQYYRLAKLWIPEYGSADDPTQFEYLRRYSPYHNVHEGTHYPAVLLTTATSDSRVDPMHARKMAALMQPLAGPDNPVLLRVEDEAGHGQGKPLSKQLDEQTDIWSFLTWQLSVTVP